ncbi:MAG TPA: type II toxin-antitoxin system RelE/ParE family toxin [Acidobacteriota bacterium]|nr:type II toxin-antitoxin system RelE/ParE family toxin [Acidobacteriota bacterium]
MTNYRVVAQPLVDQDVEAAFEWYHSEKPGLGYKLLDQLRACYDRILQAFKYQVLRFGIRRALLARFPYAVYYAVEENLVVVLAVLHAKRDPAEWQRRGV